MVGLSIAVKAVVLLWHCEQSPVAGCAESATAKVLALDFGRVWKPLYCAPLTSVEGEIG